VSELSEHDRAELQRIELELMTQDPRLARLLESFSRGELRRRLPRRVRWLYLDLLLLTALVAVPLLVVFVH
jgi:hypothetical protein